MNLVLSAPKKNTESKEDEYCNYLISESGVNIINGNFIFSIEYIENIEEWLNFVDTSKPFKLTLSYNSGQVTLYFFNYYTLLTYEGCYLEFKILYEW